MSVNSDRLEREKRTIRYVISIYCSGHHHSENGLCDRCRDLLEYAVQRILACPLADCKPVCGKCTADCYDPALRKEMRQVMQYAGAPMMVRHPVLAVRHLMDALKNPDKCQ